MTTMQSKNTSRNPRVDALLRGKGDFVGASVGAIVEGAIVAVKSPKLSTAPSNSLLSSIMTIWTKLQVLRKAGLHFASRVNYDCLGIQN